MALPQRAACALGWPRRLLAGSIVFNFGPTPSRELRVQALVSDVRDFDDGTSRLSYGLGKNSCLVADQNDEVASVEFSENPQDIGGISNLRIDRKSTRLNSSH